MAYVNGLTVNARAEVLGLPDFEEFLGTLYAHAESVLQLAPSNSTMNIDVRKRGSSYRVVVNLASAVLGLLEEAEARSPFVALDSVLLKTREALQVWSIKKRV